MTLKYTHHPAGFPIINFHLQPTRMESTQQCFQVSGEQKEINKYLETIGALKGGYVEDLVVVYNIDSGSRNTSVGFVDANVSIFFCDYQFVPIPNVTFEQIFITPFIGTYF
ncbi:hypothetical protein [Escherichia coli]|uniref:hypothetical protein n=1 Tax=Escherichia coli TaxID=562 RepID=UPI00390BBEB8|nr:hypothetical protein [Escherichia coli]